MSGLATVQDKEEEEEEDVDEVMVKRSACVWFSHGRGERGGGGRRRRRGDGKKTDLRLA